MNVEDNLQRVKMDDLCDNYVIKQYPESYTIEIIDGKPQAIPDSPITYITPEEDDLKCRIREIYTTVQKVMSLSSGLRVFKKTAIDFKLNPITFRWYKPKQCDELGNPVNFECNKGDVAHEMSTTVHKDKAK